MRYESELYHHGILGQKWGSRNGPPYPLGSSDHSSSEKKAGWRKSLNSKSGSESLSNRDKKKITKQYTKALNKSQKEVNKIATRENITRATDKQMYDVENATNSTAKEFYKYQKEQEEKLGYDNYYFDSGQYMYDWDQAYAKVFDEIAADFVVEGLKNSKANAEAHELVEKYDMTSWSDIARSNEANIENWRKASSKNSK